MRVSYIIILGIFLHACANPVSPTGGIKDIEPPVVIDTQITESNSNKQLVLSFNENIVVSNKLFFNPQHIRETKPVVTKTNKTISIAYKPYHHTLIFNESIKDLNEGNIYKPKVYSLKNNDTLILNKPISLPKYFDKDKKSIESLHYLNDSLLYRSIYDKDTLRFIGFPTNNVLVTTFLDKNKNSQLDSSEWYFKDSIFSQNKIHLYPPKKHTVILDTNSNPLVFIAPFYIIPQYLSDSNIKAISGDTCILYKSTSNPYSKSNYFKETIIQYKTIKSNYSHIKQSTIREKDTLITTISNPLFRTASNNPKNDTLSKNIKIGKVHWIKSDSLPNIHIILLRENQYYHHFTLTQDSLTLEISSGNFQFIAYGSIDSTNHKWTIWNEQTPIYHYFEEFLVKPNLDNVINIGKAVKKDTEIGGKGTKSMNKKSGVPSGVNQLKSIPK